MIHFSVKWSSSHHSVQQCGVMLIPVHMQIIQKYFPLFQSGARFHNRSASGCSTDNMREEICQVRMWHVACDPAGRLTMIFYGCNAIFLYDFSHTGTYVDQRSWKKQQNMGVQPRCSSYTSWSKFYIRVKFCCNPLYPELSPLVYNWATSQYMIGKTLETGKPEQNSLWIHLPL